MPERSAWSSLWSQAPPQVRRPRRPGEPGEVEPHWTAWLLDPRSAVLLALGSAIVVGGGRRLYIGWKSRQAIDKLHEESPTPDDIRDAGKFGRDGLIEMFRLLDTAPLEASRLASGRALAGLWYRDDLIAEEEKALIRRGCRLEWSGRRRLPRALTEPFEIAVSMNVPFLSRDPEGEIGSENLEWSFRVTGTQRASLEAFSAWRTVNQDGPITFQIDPRDFSGRGPHRLVLQARVRTVGLKDSWEFELPHIPFSFEFDPILEVDAILATRDDSRATAVEQGVRLLEQESDPALFVPITHDLMIRNPPRLSVVEPIPCDLAHRVEVEIEGTDQRIPAGRFVSTESRRTAPAQPPRAEAPLTMESILGNTTLDRPGPVRIRVHLTPDPQVGWANPEVRSLWPGSVTTNWSTVQVVRR